MEGQLGGLGCSAWDIWRPSMGPAGGQRGREHGTRVGPAWDKHGAIRGRMGREGEASNRFDRADCTHRYTIDQGSTRDRARVDEGIRSRDRSWIGRLRHTASTLELLHGMAQTRSVFDDRHRIGSSRHQVEQARHRSIHGAVSGRTGQQAIDQVSAQQHGRMTEGHPAVDQDRADRPRINTAVDIGTNND